MPQLDFSFYLSQICWLLVSFGIFFCVSKFFVLPKLNCIFSQREKLINDNLSYAEKMLFETNKIKQTYNDTLMQNITINQEKIDNLSKELDAKSKKKIEEFQKSFLLEKNRYIASIREEIYHLDANTLNSVIVAIQNFLENTFNIKMSEENIKNKIYEQFGASNFNV